MTGEDRERRDALVALYAPPYEAAEPVVWLAEKSQQWWADTRPPVALAPGRPGKEDYEYTRPGARNLFVAVAPKGGRREVRVTARRTKKEFVTCVRSLVPVVYASARKLHRGVDTLNPHCIKSFQDVLGPEPATVVLERLDFHYTPKHARGLNRAEGEISVLEKPGPGRRIPTEARWPREVVAWQQKRKVEKRGMEWAFPREKADQKLARHYVA